MPTCAIEITGSHLGKIAERLSSETGLDVRAVGSDRSFLSSKFGGVFGMLDLLMSFIKPCERKAGTVNLVSRWFYNLGKDENMESIRKILNTVGLDINMGFLDLCSISDIEKFDSAEFDIQLGYGPLNDRISERLAEVTGRQRAIVMEMPLGLSGAVRWIDILCDRIPSIADRRDDAKTILRDRFNEGISRFKEKTSGKRAVLYTMMEGNMDWQIEALRELDMEIVAIMIAPGPVTNHNVRRSDYESIPVIRDGSICGLRELNGKESFDIVITNDPDRVSRAGFRWAPFGARGIGVDTSIEWAQTVSDCLTAPTGDWEARL